MVTNWPTCSHTFTYLHDGATTTKPPHWPPRAFASPPLPARASPRPLSPSARVALSARGGALALQMSASPNAAVARGGEDSSAESGKALRIMASLFGWYFLNAVFAIMNKRTLLCFPHPWQVPLINLAPPITFCCFSSLHFS